MTDRKKPSIHSKLKWITEIDNGHPMHYIDVGDFEIVIHEYSKDNYNWFVNTLDKTGDIDWHAFIEGTENSLNRAKKTVLKEMLSFLTKFKNFEKQIENV